MHIVEKARAVFAAVLVLTTMWYHKYFGLCWGLVLVPLILAFAASHIPAAERNPSFRTLHKLIRCGDDNMGRCAVTVAWGMCECACACVFRSVICRIALGCTIVYQSWGGYITFLAAGFVFIPEAFEPAMKLSLALFVFVCAIAGSVAARFLPTAWVAGWESLQTQRCV